MTGSVKPAAPALSSADVRSRRPRTRTVMLWVRVTPEEAARIRALAYQHGRGVSAYLRDLALDEGFRNAHKRYIGALAARLAGRAERFTRFAEGGGR